MLKKLFLYEWKYCWKILSSINLCLLIFTVIGVISIFSPIWTLDYPIVQALMFLAVSLYYVAIFAGSIIVCVYLGARFYKNVYTDEGYLTNTLPVTPRQIILSKTFVSTIWIAITSIVIVFSVIILIHSALLSYGDINMFHEFGNAWDVLMTIGKKEWGTGNLAAFLFSLLLSALVSPFFSVLMMYSSISLGQLFTKHKIIGTIIWYIAENTIIQIVTSIIINVPLLSGLLEAELNDRMAIMIINPIMYGSILLSIAATVALYFITEYMLKKKLNLD